MINFGSLVLFICVISSGAIPIEENDDLKAVVVLFRHGDRAPMDTWPTDEYYGDTSLWPDGYGQLNNFGKQRQYRLGQWFRNRYDGFLPARYNISDIYVRSTDVDRTLMSAASNLAGLYPPSGDQIWNDNIPWQAIPIHTTPGDNDPVLVNISPCPKHNKLKQELLNSSEFQQFYHDHAEFFQNISQVTGVPIEEVDLVLIAGMFSSITIYREFNLTLPEWTDVYWSEIETLAAIKFQIDTYTQEMARLIAGPFNSYLIDYFNAIKNRNNLQSSRQENKQLSIEDTEIRKFLMLSAHDDTIVDRINAIGVYPNAVPEFASSVIWELKRRNGSDDDFYLNMYFKNSTHFSPLTLPGCEFSCSIDDFAAILKPVSGTVEQLTQECYDI